MGKLTKGNKNNKNKKSAPLQLDISVCVLRPILTPQLPPSSLFIAISPSNLSSHVQFPL